MLVVADIIARLRAEYGRMRRSDWEAYLTRCGVSVQYRDFGDVPVTGVVRGNTIFLQHGLSKDETERVVFHEFGHFATHEGDIRWWRTRPQGHITAAKFERQAEEFAALFPDWCD